LNRDKQYRKRIRKIRIKLLIAIFVTCPLATGQIFDQTLTEAIQIPENETLWFNSSNTTLDNAQIDVFGNLRFTNTNMLIGSGNINLYQSGDLILDDFSTSTPNVLTVGSGIRITGSRLDGPGAPWILARPSNGDHRLVNHGIIAASGNLNSTQSDLAISSSIAFENHGQVVAQANSVLDAYVEANWINNGIFKAQDGGNFALQGTFSPNQLGALAAENGGYFSIAGTVENQSNTWLLNQSTGSFLLRSSTIKGGRIVGQDGTKLYSIESGQTLGTLKLAEGVTLDIDVDIKGRYSDVKVNDGLIINRTFTHDGDTLSFDGAQTIGGTGTLAINESVQYTEQLTIDRELTVERVSHFSKNFYSSAPGAKIQNLGTMKNIGLSTLTSNTGKLHNKGLVQADKGLISLGKHALNQGTVLTTGTSQITSEYISQEGEMIAIESGRLTINSGTNSNSGTIHARNGGELLLRGNIQNAGDISVTDGYLLWDNPIITGKEVVTTNSTIVLVADNNIADLPTITNIHSTWAIGNNATLDNTNHTLTLAAVPSRQWKLIGGNLAGGTVNTLDKTPLLIQSNQSVSPSFQSSITDASVAVSVIVQENAELSLRGSTTLNDRIYVHQNASLQLHDNARVNQTMHLDGGNLTIHQPTSPFNIPDIDGQHGSLALALNQIDLDTQTWVIPTPLDEIYFGIPKQRSDFTIPYTLKNGTIEGNRNQTIHLSDRGSDLADIDYILQDLTLDVDAYVNESYTIAGIEGSLRLNDATIHISGGPSRPSGRALRHGELRILKNGNLEGVGTITFTRRTSSIKTGVLSTETNQLLINPGITLLAGNPTNPGRGWLAAPDTQTINRGVFESYAQDDESASLKTLGDFAHKGILKIHAGGWLEVDKTATLEGILDFRLTDDFTFNDDTRLTVLRAQAISGQFSNFTGDIDFNNRPLVLDYLNTEISLRLATYGDADADGDVDTDDLHILAAAFDTDERSWRQGDFNGDTIVDLDDLTILGTFFGIGVEPANEISFADALKTVSFNTVPEPKSIFWIGTMFLSIMSRRQTKHSTSTRIQA